MSENKAKTTDISSYYAPFHTHTQLSPAELDFLTSNSSAALTAFESVSEKSGASEKLLAMAGSQVESAQKWHISPHASINQCFNFCCWVFSSNRYHNLKCECWFFSISNYKSGGLGRSVCPCTQCLCVSYTFKITFYNNMTHDFLCNVHSNVIFKWSCKMYNTKICAQWVLLFLCFGLFLRLLVAMVTSPVMASWTFSHSSFKSVPSEGWEVRGCREERRRVGSKRGDSCVWGCGYEEVVSVIHEDGLKTWMSWFTSSLLLSVTTNLSTIFSSGFRSLAGLSSSKQAESSVAQWDWSWGTTLGRWLHSTWGAEEGERGW